MMILAIVPMVVFLVVGSVIAGPDDKMESRRVRDLIRKVQLDRGYKPCGSE